MQWFNIVQRIVGDSRVRLPYSVVKHAEALCPLLQSAAAVEGHCAHSIAAALVLYVVEMEQDMGHDVSCMPATIALAAGIHASTLKKNLTLVRKALPTVPRNESASVSPLRQGESKQLIASPHNHTIEVKAKHDVKWRDECGGESLADVRVIENCLQGTSRSSRPSRKRPREPLLDTHNTGQPSAEDDELSYRAAVRSCQARGKHSEEPLPEVRKNASWIHGSSTTAE